MADDPIRAHCNNCLGERDHEILHAHETTLASVDTEGVVFTSLLMCRGCRDLVLRRVSRVWPLSDTSAITESNAHYPPRASRREPPWLSGVPDETIRNLLGEIYISTQNQLNRLAAMGVRALVEYVFITTCGRDHGTFANNLGAFQEAGHISTAQHHVFEIILEAGHATMHRAFSPSDEDIVTLLDTVETMLEQLYVHPTQVAALENRIPPRPPRS